MTPSDQVGAPMKGPVLFPVQRKTISIPLVISVNVRAAKCHSSGGPVPHMYHVTILTSQVNASTSEKCVFPPISGSFLIKP